MARKTYTHLDVREATTITALHEASLGLFLQDQKRDMPVRFNEHTLGDAFFLLEDSFPNNEISLFARAQAMLPKEFWFKGLHKALTVRAPHKPKQVLWVPQLTEIEARVIANHTPSWMPGHTCLYAWINERDPLSMVMAGTGVFFNGDGTTRQHSGWAWGLYSSIKGFAAIPGVRPASGRYAK